MRCRGVRPLVAERSATGLAVRWLSREFSTGYGWIGRGGQAVLPTAHRPPQSGPAFGSARHIRLLGVHYARAQNYGQAPKFGHSRCARSTSHASTRHSIFTIDSFAVEDNDEPTRRRVATGVHTQARPVSRVHPRLHAGERTSTRRGRHDAILPRHTPSRPSDGAQAGAARANLTKTRRATKHRRRARPHRLTATRPTVVAGLSVWSTEPDRGPTAIVQQPVGQLPSTPRRIWRLVSTRP